MGKVATIILLMIIAFILGLKLSYLKTMENIKAYSEYGNIIVLEVYGNEWIYEE